MNIDMGIASDVLDLQNSDSFIHHCINHPHSFFHRLRVGKYLCFAVDTSLMRFHMQL